MKKFLAAFFILVISSLAQAMCRLNEQNKSFEAPFKTYRHAQTAKTIRVLSMCHIAQAGFYQCANELISDKIVIYEFNGGDWSQHCRSNQEIKLLDPTYAHRFSLVMLNNNALLAKHHGLSYQGDCLKYDLAKKLVHADQQRESKTSLWDSRGAKVCIDSYIIQLYNNLAAHFGLPAESEIDKMAEVIYATMSKQFPDLRSYASLIIKESNNLVFQEQFIQNRNPILKQKILESLPDHDELVITYGAAHLVEIENFLVELGFALYEETWMTVFEL